MFSVLTKTVTFDIMVSDTSKKQLTLNIMTNIFGDVATKEAAVSIPTSIIEYNCNIKLVSSTILSTQ